MTHGSLELGALLRAPTDPPGYAWHSQGGGAHLARECLESTLRPFPRSPHWLAIPSPESPFQDGSAWGGLLWQGPIATGGHVWDAMRKTHFSGSTEFQRLSSAAAPLESRLWSLRSSPSGSFPATKFQNDSVSHSQSRALNGEDSTRSVSSRSRSLNFYSVRESLAGRVTRQREAAGTGGLVPNRKVSPQSQVT